MNNLPKGSRPSSNDPVSYVTDLISQTVFNTRLIWGLFWDGRVKLVYKMIPIGAFLYGISPIDLVPEAALGLIGTVDDFVIITGGVTWFFSLCRKNSPTAFHEHVKRLKE